MSDENWMVRLLSDARDLALQANRAKLQAQQQQLAQAEGRIAELIERHELFEARVVGLLRHLLGEPGLLALRELLEAEEFEALEQLGELDRELLERLATPKRS
ncbi:MAG: hypothetical protein R6X02_35625 [Enhygromyxa sp.]